MLANCNKYLFLPNLGQYNNLSQFSWHNFIDCSIWYQCLLSFTTSCIRLYSPCLSWDMSLSMERNDRKIIKISSTKGTCICYHSLFVTQHCNLFANTNSIEFKNSKKDQIAAIFPSLADHGQDKTNTQTGLGCSYHQVR